jgi:hypothetical protein
MFFVVVRYANYGSFLSDIKQIFANAIKFNSVFKDTDPVSLTILEAAHSFGAMVRKKYKT